MKIHFKLSPLVKCRNRDNSDVHRVNTPSFFIFFAGFLGYVRSTLARDVELLPAFFLRIPLIEGYVEFLKVRENIYKLSYKENHINGYGWQNGLKFTKFIFIHIHCSECY